MDKKVIMGENHVFLNLENNTRETNCFEANKLIFPIPQMNIRLNLKEIGSSSIQ